MHAIKANALRCACDITFLYPAKNVLAGGMICAKARHKRVGKVFICPSFLSYLTTGERGRALRCEPEPERKLFHTEHRRHFVRMLNFMELSVAYDCGGLVLQLCNSRPVKSGSSYRNRGRRIAGANNGKGEEGQATRRGW